MTLTVPSTIKQWNVVGQDGLDSLRFTEQPVPEFRDIVIPRGKYPWHVKPNVVPGLDGAGIVLAVGKNVTRFKPGDKVVTTLHMTHIAGPIDTKTTTSGVGAAVDGTFRSVGVFSEEGLVSMPRGLTFVEAASLSCAGVTAWNALFGLEGKRLSAGQWILTQGTGGVSLFAVQFAKVVGARVIATTSSDEKAEILRQLGADHIINYRETRDWGAAAKELTEGVGVDMVVDVAGPSSLKQSAASVRLDGTIVTVGFVGGDGGGEMPTLLDTWLSMFTARGIWVGTRIQMEEMGRAIEANLEKLRPVIDPKVFKLEELRDAYEYLESGKHQGKVAIEIE
ncbi:Zinc-type alcohol dehydrogenase-like protein [Colletotrichum spinosum]|uniref:Zinc-type alcohol dehydrogenase-like protein n=1 Tax=Colletotrichum spinosum TaxID=1347390 RepID=A0A4R8QP95_9PEZI|nr:Zinc-type alcohol dehydrogenase-like protein [Colletotrichum spinosum]